MSCITAGTPGHPQPHAGSLSTATLPTYMRYHTASQDLAVPVQVIGFTLTIRRACFRFSRLPSQTHHDCIEGVRHSR